jgi:hypothetical protein
LRLAAHTQLLREEVWNRLPADLFDAPVSFASIGIAAPQRIKVGLRGGGDGRTGGGEPKIKMGSGSNPLDSFFPFDPCLLSHTHAMLAGDRTYRVWRGIPGIDVEEEFNVGDRDGEGGNLLGTVLIEGDETVMSSSVSSTSTFSHSVAHTYGTDGGGGISMSIGAGSLDLGNPLHELQRHRSDSITGSSEGGWGREDEHYQEQDVGGLVQAVCTEGERTSGWSIPIRRPRQYSISSCGSW